MDYYTDNEEKQNNEENSNYDSSIIIDEEILNRKGLWNPGRFLVISVLFSFLPAAILFGMNYGRIGEVKKRNIVITAAIIGFAIAVAIVYPIQEALGKALFWGLNIGLAFYMKGKQEAIYEDHIARGGKKASFLLPVIISLVCTAVVLVFIFWSASIAEYIPDSSKNYFDDEIYYTSEVNLDYVDAVGRVLEEAGFFMEDGKTISAKLDKEGDYFVFSMVIYEERIDDEEVISYFEELRKYFSDEVFNGANVKLQLCDEYFRPLRTIE
ncbi:MAG: hypothetical protein ACOZCL_09985 [Bacillota bacterium]